MKSYRNLALNVNDTHENTTCFPHAFANVETRGESVFAAKNAIDGVTANECHGEWPYDSWGINRNPDAEMTVDFGREVEIDRIILYIRADFPHDNWWKKVTVTFSDGEEKEFSLKKTGCGQEFTFEKKKSDLGEAVQADSFPGTVTISGSCADRSVRNRFVKKTGIQEQKHSCMPVFVVNLFLLKYAPM